MTFPRIYILEPLFRILDTKTGICKSFLRPFLLSFLPSFRNFLAGLTFLFPFPGIAIWKHALLSKYSCILNSKVKFTQEQATTAQKGSIGIALLFL